MNQVKEITVIIADDHAIFRDGLKVLLKKQDKKIKIVAEAADGVELLEKVEKYKPRVVITDVKMPRLDGEKAVKIIRKKYSNIGIIALSSYDEDCIVNEMYDAGINAFLLKNADKNEMIHAICEAIAGQNYYSSSISHCLMKKMSPAISRKNLCKASLFSERELDILKLVAKQMTNKEIADKMHLSIRTVEDHIKRIKQKTGAVNMVGVTLWAVKHHIIQI